MHNKNNSRIHLRLAPLFVALVFVLALIPAFATTVFAANTNVGDEATLRSTLSTASPGDTITLTASFNLTSTLGISTTGTGVTLLSGTGGPYTLTATGGFNAVNVAASATLILGTGAADGVNITHTAGQTGSGVNIASGGIFILNSGTISGNTSFTGGGVNNFGTFTMNGGTISYNSATSPNIYGSAGNTGPAGGGVYNGPTGSSGAVFTMNGGLIDNNTASAGYAGGVSVYTNSSFTFKAGTISNNHAKSGAGVMLNGGTMTMAGGTVSGNINDVSPAGSGAGIYSADNNGGGCSLTISGGTVSGNQAPYGSAGGLFVSTGSGISVTDANGGLTLTGNSAAVNAGGAYFGVPVVITGATITDNTASGAGTSGFGGGGIYGTSNGQPITLIGCTISDNKAPMGGGLYTTGGNVVITGSTISDNEATGGAGGITTAPDGSGGGVCFNGGGTVVLTNDVFSDNTAASDGGGIWMNSLPNLRIDTALNPNQSTFTGNSASQAYIRTPGVDLVDDHNYNSNVFTGTWTSPFAQGYNNYDINFISGTPFTGNMFTVTFKDQDPAAGTASTIKTVDVAENCPVGAKNLPASTPNHLPSYLFVGWSDGTLLYDAQQLANYVVTDEVTFTAQYVPIGGSGGGTCTCPTLATVIFNYNGGFDGDGNIFIVRQGDPGDTLLVPSGITRDGFVFNNWDTAPTTAFGDAGTITAYYAQWLPAGSGAGQTYTVTFLAGANGTMDPASHSETVDFGASVTSVPAIAAGSGYTFTGWLSSNGGVYTSDAVAALAITADTTFTAQYKSNSGGGGNGGGGNGGVPITNGALPQLFIWMGGLAAVSLAVLLVVKKRRAIADGRH